VALLIAALIAVDVALSAGHWIDRATRQVVFDTAMIALPVGLAIGMRASMREALCVRRMSVTPGRAALWIFLGSAAATLAGIFYVVAFNVRGHTWLTSLRPHGTQAVVLGVAAVTIVPIAEEVFWRGMIHRALRVRMTMWPAVAISSTAFGLVHSVGGDDFSTVPPRIFYGVLLALLLEWSGSLYPGMVAHAYINLTVLDLFVPSLATAATLILLTALVVVVAVSVNDPRRKKAQQPASHDAGETALRTAAARERAHQAGRLGTW
jgi:membrane protease YdiL (CAAX protease family)